jgi:hypothetical protein
LSSSSLSSLKQPQQRKHKREDSQIKYIIDDKSLTFAEKLISIKNVERLNKKSKALSMAGEIVIVDVDLTMAQDSTGPLALRSFKSLVGY